MTQNNSIAFYSSLKTHRFEIFFYAFHAPKNGFTALAEQPGIPRLFEVTDTFSNRNFSLS